MSYSPPPPHAKWEMPADPDKTLDADDDDAEARLDDAERSHDGNERCARCSEGDDFALLISGMDEALIAYADRLLVDDRVWNQLKAVRQAMAEAL